ncbi:MAG: hotdog fold domain-containing protein [Gammaproteobacteria bacterium]|nr:hotdog fold domain-containing protein [Gammaproteobacteria bacterium]MCZ6716318.1 hotdog fold domain-containing protein [Gammaproteobacteria bacterium]MCZ6827122.1 hotdog fold domain-containing protein [Gammaproteobacteria bacterium]
MAINVLNLYQRISGFPGGRWLFTRIVCFRAPYFGSIRPQFVELRPGIARVSMKKRRSVQNHIGGVHALAMGNLCELAAGMMTEVTMPRNMRWIPRGMTIQYLRQARSDVSAEARLELREYNQKEDVVVDVEVMDREGTRVVRAEITMYISPRD